MLFQINVSKNYVMGLLFSSLLGSLLNQEHALYWATYILHSVMSHNLS
jgi:hypothetical protein